MLTGLCAFSKGKRVVVHTDLNGRRVAVYAYDETSARIWALGLHPKKLAVGRVSQEMWCSEAASVRLQASIGSPSVKEWLTATAARQHHTSPADNRIHYQLG
jgi:hypothetical protein